MSDNMKIWDAVSKTDPKHTKKVTFGRKFTAIDAHYQVMKATEQFGPVGEGWGYNVEHGSIKVDDDTMLAYSDVWLWQVNIKHTFGPFRGMSELRWLDKNGVVKHDTDAFKKAMTDALTKGLSHLGFSADVFLGLFDDNKYVQQREAEEKKGSKEINDLAWATDLSMKLMAADSADRLSEMWAKLQPYLEGRSNAAITMLEDAFQKTSNSFKEKT